MTESEERKMNDCIDREELIGSIQYLFDGLADSWVEASEKIIEIIREEPTVPQKEYTEQQIRDTFNSGFSCGMEREWIDTEEEMPIDGEEVLVSVYWTDYGDTILAYGHYNARVDNWKLYSDSEGELIKGYEVVAWMPMPYPYTKDSYYTGGRKNERLD